MYVIFAFLPVENLFITFDSPEAAYEYYNWGGSNVELIIEGNSCDFVVDRQSEFDTYLIIPKTTDGWKIGIGSNTRRIAQKISDGIVLYIFQYKNTNDYFITIMDTNGGESKISDDYNTEFYALEKNNPVLKNTFITYYAHVPDFNSQYSVTVNDNLIVF